MKFLRVVSLSKVILGLGVFLIAGCSPAATTPPSFITTVENTPIPSLAAIFPHSGKIAYLYSTSDTGYYHRIHVLSDNRVIDITPNLPEIGGLAWSPGGEELAFHATKEGKSQIFAISADGNNLRQLTFGEEGSFSPSWSPDGEYIIFLSFQKDTLDYRGLPTDQGYIMKSDGTELRQLQDNHDLAVKALSYRRDNFISISVPATIATTRTYIISSDGMIQRQFPEFTIDGIPIWSPNGESIVFSTIRSDCSGIVIMQMNDTNEQCLMIDEMVPPLVYVSGASWSPDGKYIMFSSNLGGDWNIYVVRPDGSELTQITNLAGDERGAAWSSSP
jgi:TolB protein